MNLKYIVTLISVAVLFTSCTTSNQEVTNSTTSTTEIATQTTENQLVQPDRKLDIYGKIVSMEGNEVTILQTDTSKDPTFNMTSEEKKKYMQSLDEAARTALKEEINNVTLGEVKLTIPVGIPMTKKETSGPDAPSLEASIADLKVGQYISVWLNTQIENQKIAEFVKIAFTQ